MKTWNIVKDEKFGFENISFTQKPTEEMREAMKKAGWRYSSNFNRWYPKTEVAKKNTKKFIEGFEKIFSGNEVDNPVNVSRINIEENHSENGFSSAGGSKNERNERGDSGHERNDSAGWKAGSVQSAQMEEQRSVHGAAQAQNGSGLADSERTEKGYEGRSGGRNPGDIRGEQYQGDSLGRGKLSDAGQVNDSAPDGGDGVEHLPKGGLDVRPLSSAGGSRKPGNELEEKADSDFDANVKKLQDALKDALKQVAVPLEKIEFTRENYNKLFPEGYISTPIENVKMGAHQFEKLEAKQREFILQAAHDTLATPDIIINETRKDVFGEDEDNHLYAKSYLINDKVYGIQSVVVSIDGENVSISTHERGINNIMNKIKKPDQLLYAAAKVRLLVERAAGKQLVTVNPIRDSEYVASPKENIQRNSKPVKQSEKKENQTPEQKAEQLEKINIQIRNENVSISTHERDINNTVNKIKKPDQLLYAAAKARPLVEQHTENPQLMVNPIRDSEYVASPRENIQRNSKPVKQSEKTKKQLTEIRSKCREILKKTDSEITEDDKKILSQYEGAGGLNESNRSVNGVLNEFYTPQNLVDKVWKLVDHYAPDAKTVLEPSSGIGKFANNRPKNGFTMHELDETSARIAKILHPGANVIQGAYQRQFFDDGGRVRKANFVQPKYDVVIGNPPYGKYNDIYKGLGEGKEFDRYEEYFISKGLDALKDEKSVLAFVVPSGFLKSANDSQKKILAQKGELIDAYRLPNKAFPTTEVGTDIIVMKTWDEKKRKLEWQAKDNATYQKAEIQSWTEKEAFKLSNDQWFKNHPEKILGETKEITNRFGKPDFEVALPDGASLDDELKRIDGFLENSSQVEEPAETKQELAGNVNNNSEITEAAKRRDAINEIMAKSKSVWDSQNKDWQNITRSFNRAIINEDYKEAKNVFGSMKNDNPFNEYVDIWKQALYIRDGKSSKLEQFENYLAEHEEDYIHSEEFISKFGDWEKANRIEKLKNASNLEFSKEIRLEYENLTEQVESLIENEDRKGIISLEREIGKTVVGNYINDDLNENIIVTNNNIREISHHHAMYYEHILSIGKIPEIIKNGIYISDVENEDKIKHPNIEKYQYFATGIKIGEEYYTCKSVVGIDKGNNCYYDQSLSTIEKGKLIDIIQQKNKPETVNLVNTKDSFEPNKHGNLSHLIATWESELPENESPSAYYDKRLINICQVPQMPYLEMVNGKWQPKREAVQAVNEGKLFIERKGQGYIMHDEKSPSIEQNDDYIHSEEFISKFGDWEKANRLEKLRNAESIIKDGKITLSNSDITETVESLIYNGDRKGLQSLEKEIGKNILGSYINQDTGLTINVSNRNVTEISNHHYLFKEHIQSLAYVPEIIDKAILIGEVENEDKQKHPNIEKYLYFGTGIKIDGVDYTCKSVIGIDKNNNCYYDQSLSTIEKGRLVDYIFRNEKVGNLSPLITQRETDLEGNNLPYVYYDKRLINICQVPQMPYLEMVNGKWQPKREAVQAVKEGKLFIERNGQDYIMHDEKPKQMKDENIDNDYEMSEKEFDNFANNIRHAEEDFLQGKEQEDDELAASWANEDFERTQRLGEIVSEINKSDFKMEVSVENNLRKVVLTNKKGEEIFREQETGNSIVPITSNVAVWANDAESERFKNLADEYFNIISEDGITGGDFVNKVFEKNEEPDSKTYHTLKEEDVKDLKIVSDEELKERGLFKENANMENTEKENPEIPKNFLKTVEEIEIAIPENYKPLEGIAMERRSFATALWYIKDATEENKGMKFYGQIWQSKIEDIAEKHNVSTDEIIDIFYKSYQDINKTAYLKALSTEKEIEEKTQKFVEEMKGEHAENQATNYVLEKFKEAGIEVVTDKDEFNRILKSASRLQKMTEDLSEYEKLFEKANEEKAKTQDISSEKKSLEELKEENAKKHYDELLSFVEQTKKFIPEEEINTFRSPDGIKNRIPLIKNKKGEVSWWIANQKTNSGSRIVAVTEDNARDAQCIDLSDYEELRHYIVFNSKYEECRLNDSTLLDSYKENLKTYLEQKITLEQQKQNRMLSEIGQLKKDLAKNSSGSKGLASDFERLDKSLRLNSNFEIESSGLGENVSVFPGSTGKSGLGIRHIIEERFKKDNLSTDEIAALCGLILETVRNGEITRDSKNRCEFSKNGIIAIVRKDFDSQEQNWILTGFHYTGEDEQKNREAAETIKTVIADYSNSDGYSYFRSQVGAVIASLDSNISQNQDKSIIQKITGTLTPEEQKRYFTFNEADTAKFKSQVEEWKKSKDENQRFNPGKLIKVGEIPPLFNALGIADNPIEVQYSTLSKMVRPLPEGYPNEAQGHALSVDDIYAIPSQLADPVMVFKSRTRDDSYVFFTERKDSQKHSILIPMAVNRHKGRIVINEITSMYGKDNEIDFVKTNIDEGNLIYADKKRSLKWERECKVQFLTQGLPNQDFKDNILTKERLVNFIFSDSQKIKPVQKMSAPRANVLSPDLKGFKNIADRICAIDELAKERIGATKIRIDAKAAEEYFSFLKSHIDSVSSLRTSVFNELEDRNCHTATAALSIMGFFGKENQEYFAQRSERNKENPDNYDFPPEIVSKEIALANRKKEPKIQQMKLSSSISEDIESLFVSKNEENLNSEIDKLTEKDVSLKDDFITISEKTPFIFKEFGLDDFPVNMYKQKLARAFFLEEQKFGERITHGHKGEFTSTTVKEVFKDLGNPRYIFNSKQNLSNPKDFYLIGVYDELDEQKNPMILSLHFNKDRKEVEANWITSIYGKRKNILVNDWTQKGYLVYMNDLEMEKAPAEVVTLQMRVSKSASAYINNVKKKSDFVNDFDVAFNKNQENVYGFAYEGKIYLNPDFMNSNVAVHEYTHLWDEYTRRTNPELWQKGMNILKDTKFWSEVKSDPNYADIAEDDNLVLSEVHARITGEMAQKILERIAKEDGEITKEKAIDWDEEVFDYVYDEFGLGKGKHSAFAKEKMNGYVWSDYAAFLTTPIKDLMSGKNISLNQAEVKNQSRKPQVEINSKAIDAVNAVGTRKAAGRKESVHSGIDGDNKSLREYEDKTGLFNERKILSMQEFSKFYTGEDFSPVEYNIWAATNYKGFIDTEKLSDEEKNFIKNSDRYVESEKGKFQNAMLFASGNIYDKLDELESKKDMIPPESYKKCKSILEKAKPEPVKIEDIKLDALSPLAEEFKVTRTLETYTGIGESTEKQKVELNIREDFINWATGSGAGQNPDSDNYSHNISNWTEANVSREEFPEGIYWRDITDYIERVPVKTGISKNDTKEEQQRKEVVAGAKQDARKETAWNLFNRYLQEGLPEDDKKRFAEFWNRINNGKHELDYKKLPLFVSGMSTYKGKEPFILYKQQVEGISRLVSKGNGLLAYGVGVGKTAAGIVATAAQLESGRSKKPLIIVPNQVYTKWVNDFEQLFPNIKVNRLGNFSDDCLKNVGYSRLDHSIKIPDGSVSIMMESALGKITFSNDAISELRDEFGSVLGKTEDLDSGNDRDRAEAINEVSKLIGKASQVQERKLPSGKTEVRENPYVFIDKIGFDNVCIDEAHRFKNLYTVPAPKKSARGKPEAAEFKGIGNGGKTSKRALKVFGICSLVQKHNDNRNVFLLTATPFSNNPLEVYSMLSLVARKELKDRHIYDVRDFCTEFAKTKFEYAVTPDGGIKPRAVMKAFKGKQKLRSLVNEFIDQKSPEDAGIPRPKGERHPVFLEMTPLQKKIMAINENIISNPDRDNKGAVLKAMSNMRTATVSPALLNPEDYPMLELPPKEELVESSPKLKFICDTVADVWKEKKECGQFIYMPQGVDYCDEVKKYLVKKGVPSDAIEFVTGKHKSKPEEKQEVADRFNNKKDKLKILIGGSNLAEGIDLNGNSVACYNTLLGWNPTETVQVEGRVWRQGNEQGKVHIFYPLLEDSIDAVMYQKYDEKSSRINDVFRDDGNGKDTIDVSEIDPEKIKFDLIKDPRKKIDMLIDQESSEYKKEINVLESRSETISDYLDTFTEQGRAKKMAEAERIKAVENVKKWRKELQENPMDYGAQISLDSAVRGRENAKKEEQKAAARLACVNANLERVGIKNPEDEVPAKIVEIASKIDELNKKIKEIEESKENRIAAEQRNLLEKKLLAKPLSETEKETVKNIISDTWYAKMKPEKTKLKGKSAAAPEVENKSKKADAVNKVEKRKEAEMQSGPAKKSEVLGEPSSVQDFGGYLFDMDEALKSKKLDRTSFKKFGSQILTKEALRTYKGLPPFIVDRNGGIKMRVFGKDFDEQKKTGYQGKEAIYPGDIVDVEVSIDDLRGFVERYVSERKIEEMENSLGNPMYKKRAVILPRLQMTDSLAKFAKDYDVNLKDFASLKNVYKKVMTGGENPILPARKETAKPSQAQKFPERNLPVVNNDYELEIG